MAHFKIENLTFSYPCSDKKALDGVSLTIERGEYVTFCGKSGSGKTTLLRHLKSVLTPHGTRTGEVLFEGTPLEKVPLYDQSARIGYVMQNPDSQIVTDKVWHELAFGLESIGCDQKTMRLRVAEMANYFGIQDWFHKNVTELSGGQKQLLNLASVMAMQPEALMTSPTSQLDPIAASDFLNTVRKINLELGTTILLSEHRLEEVFPCADRVVVMENGRVDAADSPDKIGQALWEKKSDMVAALAPSPMRIFYGTDSALPCPLTVRQGRNWLSKEWGGGKVAVKHLPDEPAFQPPEKKKAAIFVKEVFFRYEKDTPDVIKGVTLAVPKQSIFAVVGGNGTGKSTLLKVLCGILKPYRGSVYVNGQKADKYGDALFENCLAMLPQDPSGLFVKKTVKEDLLEMVEGKKMSTNQKEALILKTSDQCEVTHLLSSHPYDLSGGEQQRAALAKVLLCNPQILLLDEPTKGIDNFYKRKFASILTSLKEGGVTTLMVSHDVEFCARYADSVSMFFDGGVVTTIVLPLFFG